MPALVDPATHDRAVDGLSPISTSHDAHIVHESMKETSGIATKDVILLEPGLAAMRQ